VVGILVWIKGIQDISRLELAGVEVNWTRRITKGRNQKPGVRSYSQGSGDDTWGIPVHDIWAVDVLGSR